MNNNQSFYSTLGYWVHQHYLREPIRQVDEHTQCQTRYAFVSTSKEEHGDKDPAMTVRTSTLYRTKSGHSWVEHSPYFNVNKTLQQGRKLYQQLVNVGYSKDTAELLPCAD